MKSRPILFSVAVSSIIMMMLMINVDTINILPLKPKYSELTKDTQKQVTCLAQNIYFEALNEPLEGKKAVAFVTFNRVRSGYGDNICDVVKQKTGTVCQFSWYCDTKFTSRMLTIGDTLLYNDIMDLSIRLIFNSDKIHDVTNGSTYYHADYVNPNWVKLKKETVIGRHIFYKSTKDNIDKNKGII